VGLVAADLHDHDFDQDFGFRLVEIVDQFLRQGYLIGRAADDDRSLRGSCWMRLTSRMVRMALTMSCNSVG